MLRTIRKIKKANANDAEQILNAITQRYAALYPDWELHIVSLQKSADENEQIDKLIAFLESLRPGI